MEPGIEPTGSATSAGQSSVQPGGLAGNCGTAAAASPPGGGLVSIGAVLGIGRCGPLRCVSERAAFVGLGLGAGIGVKPCLHVGAGVAHSAIQFDKWRSFAVEALLRELARCRVQPVRDLGSAQQTVQRCRSCRFSVGPAATPGGPVRNGRRSITGQRGPRVGFGVGAASQQVSSCFVHSASPFVCWIANTG